jgi:GDP-L-fucose synthase
VQNFFFLEVLAFIKTSATAAKEEYLLTDTLEPTNEWYAIAKITGVKACQAIRNNSIRIT